MTMNVLYKAKSLPVMQNRLFDSFSEAVSCPVGDVVLVQDETSGLIHNAAFNSDLMIYDCNYQNEQGESTVFQEHLGNVAAIVERHFGGGTLIEVGCGKGRFLEDLAKRGFEITGMDPAYEGANPRIRKEYFTADTGLRADGIILRHVLEHIDGPVSFLASLRDANAGGGKIYIEVPCFDWIRERAAWFDVFYEHVNYFRLSDFDRIFGKVYESGHTFGGQYLYVIADLATVRDPAGIPFTPTDFPGGWQDSIRSHADRISKRGDGATAVWGGASKGVIFSLFMQQAGAEIKTVIDINPAKQGRYLPRTGIRISSPADGLSALEPGADIYVMNRNYLPEIRAVGGPSFNYLSVDDEIV